MDCFALGKSRNTCKVFFGKFADFICKSLIFVYTLCCKQLFVFGKGFYITGSEFFKLSKLFFCKGKMCKNVGRKLFFTFCRIWYMKQRTAGVQNNFCAFSGFFNLVYECRSFFVVVTPDIFSVYNTGKQFFVFGESILFQQIKAFFSFNKIKSDSVKTEFNDFRVKIADITKVCLQKNFCLFSCKNLFVKSFEQFFVVIGQIKNKIRFFNLNPFGA